VLLIAPAHPVDEIVERTTLALRLPHDDLCRIQFHHVELKPGATSSEMDSQALGVCDETEMLRQLQHRFAVDELAGATHIRPRFASLQCHIHDFPAGVGRMSLDKVFGARSREVASHRNIAHKIARQAAAAGSRDAAATAAVAGHATATAAVAGHATAAVAETCNAVAAVAVAIDAAAAVAVASDAEAAVTEALDADTSVALAHDADATEAVNAITSLAGTDDADTAAAVASDADAAASAAMNAIAAAAGSDEAGSTVTGRIHAVGPIGAAGFDRRRIAHTAGEGPSATVERACAQRARNVQVVVHGDIPHKMARQAAAAGGEEASPAPAGGRDPGAAITGGVDPIGPVGAASTHRGRPCHVAGEDPRAGRFGSRGRLAAQLQHGSCPQFFLQAGMRLLQRGQSAHQLLEGWFLLCCTHLLLLSAQAWCLSKPHPRNRFSISRCSSHGRTRLQRGERLFQVRLHHEVPIGSIIEGLSCVNQIKDGQPVGLLILYVLQLLRRNLFPHALRELLVVQLGVQPAEFHQFIVRSALDNLAFVYHQNDIRGQDS